MEIAGWPCKMKASGDGLLGDWGSGGGGSEWRLTYGVCQNMTTCWATGLT